ncbi:MAG: hypothetical protein INR66_11905, partial [Gordonia polyisoprenivorans]|nr:hypothetical protein [Gordonia polyisoprenivorans]
MSPRTTNVASPTDHPDKASEYAAAARIALEDFIRVRQAVAWIEVEATLSEKANIGYDEAVHMPHSLTEA